MVNIPAAASNPQSSPDALTVRVIIAAIGLAEVVVRVLAKSSSTQENIKQKKAVTPMPVRISGTKIVRKKRGKL
jgi:primosomal replication protein N